MRSFWGLVLIAVPAVAFAGPKPVADHVCAPSEGTATCPVGRARMCAKDGALAACVCPPGSQEPKGSKGECVLEEGSKPIACVVPDATIADRLGVALELGTLEQPPLPTLEIYGTADALAAVDGKEKTATDVELMRAAEATDAIEGASAYLANEASGPKRKAKLAARDQAVGRSIALRQTFVARFPKHARLDEQRVALARALLRRAAYTVVGPSVESDRKSARALLEAVVAAALGTRSSRDAAFMLGEQAVRAREWLLVAAHEERVLGWARAKLAADDHAFLAAASARLAEARLASGDLARGVASLSDAIAIGVSCSPRAECVSAASAARKVIAAAWAATSTPARATFTLLGKGSMPRHERVRPLLVLADLYAHGSGTGCTAAAEEARAWEQLL